MRFDASPMSCPDRLAELAESNLSNPFCTPAYLAYMAGTGAEVWMGGLYEGSAPVGLSGLFLWRGRLNSTMVIHSLPACASLPEYWSGLIQFGRRHGMTQIDAHSSASPPFTLPPLQQVRSSRERCEHVIDLAEYDAGVLHHNHRRNVRRAEHAGLRITRSASEPACREHLRLIQLSHIRQQQRGDILEVGTNLQECMGLCQHGCAEIFQAEIDGRPLSSVMAMLSTKGAYYKTAGTSPEGMSIGASHFLVHNIALHLKGKGFSEFNLGGALPGTSLASFKQRFGARDVPLSAATLYIGAIWRKKITQLSQAISNWKDR
jgi:hypothetical protein